MAQCRLVGWQQVWDIWLKILGYTIETTRWSIVLQGINLFFYNFKDIIPSSCNTSHEIHSTLYLFICDPVHIQQLLVQAMIKHAGGIVLVWDCFSKNTVDLVRIKRKMTEASYIVTEHFYSKKNLWWKNLYTNRTTLRSTWVNYLANNNTQLLKWTIQSSIEQL